jgi:hypothetical protein
MAYIGPEPAESFTSFATQEFSTSATTSYTLDHAVANENEIALFINNVRQQPGSGKAYTASSTTLTLSAATASTDTMYCIFLGRALQTVNPATNSITTAMISDDAVTAAKATGFGKIGQAVTGTNNAYNTSSSATSFTDVLSASGTTWETAITPTATSSKILILPSVYIRQYRNGSNEARGTINMMAKIGSGSYAEIDVANQWGAYDYGGSGILQDNQYVPIQLYSPSTTSEVKIKFQIKAADTNMAVETSWSSSTHVSRVTLLEVLA